MRTLDLRCAGDRGRFVVGWVPCSDGADRRPSQSPDAQEFVMQAARATMLDIAAATRVEQKIQDPAYKAYAQQVLGDDSKIEAELKSMAQNGA